MNIAPEKISHLALKYPYEGLSIDVFPGACFAKVPVTFRAHKTVELCFCSFYVGIKVSIILKIVRLNTGNQFKKHWELYYYSTGLDFEICLRARKVSGAFEK